MQILSKKKQECDFGVVIDAVDVVQLSSLAEPMLLTALDVIGTFAFAISGGARAVESRMDPFGVIFLAFVASVSGGILRDTLIGATPVSALLNWHNVAIAVVAGLSCFYAYRWIVRLSRPVALFDAIGLGLFCVVGARKALDAGLSPVMAALLGMLTAIGGGIAADVLTDRPPMVLRRDIYALAALAGAGLLTFSACVGVPDVVAAPLGATLAINLRMVAVSYDWHLPVADPQRLFGATVPKASTPVSTDDRDLADAPTSGQHH